MFRHLQDIDRIDVDIETPSHKCGRQAQDPCEINFKCQQLTIGYPLIYNSTFDPVHI